METIAGMYEILNIVICFNNTKELLKYIKTLSDLKDVDRMMLVIVINQGEDGSVAQLLSHAEAGKINIKIVKPDKNLGYMNGLICGYEAFRDAFTYIPRYIIMSNTDIAYENNDFITRLLHKKYAEDVWCIGPSVYVKEKGTYDNPVSYNRRSVKEIDRLILTFSIPVFSACYVWLSTVKGRLFKRDKEDSSYVYEVHGCYFVLTGDFGEYLRGKRFGTFLYSEEAYIAELVYRNGRKVFYDSDLEVIHLEHTVTGKLKYKKIADYLKESMKYIKREFYL